MFHGEDQATLNELLRRRTHPLRYDHFSEEFAPPKRKEYLKYAKNEHDFKDFKDREKDKAARILFKKSKEARQQSSSRSSRHNRDERRRPSKSQRIEDSFENTPIEIPGVDNDRPSLPEGLFSIHSNFSFLGPTRSGKTTACINLVAQYLRHKAFTHIKVISPTFESNPELKLLFHYLKIPDEEISMHVCEHADQAIGCLSEWIDDFKAEGEEWEHAKNYKKAYKKYKRGADLSDSELFMLQATQFSPPPTNMKKPSMAIIVDDMTHTALLSRHNSAYGHILIKHRHLGGKNIGVSFFTLVHNYKTGIPKMARQNIHIYIMFPMADTSQLQTIWEETTGSSVNFEEFARLYREAIRDEEAESQGKQSHNFFVVDVYNPDINKRFRRNFNEYLIPRVLTEEEKEEEIASAK